MLNCRLKSNPNRGFTLIEMLLYVVLVTIVGSAIVGFGVWAIQVGAKVRANAEVLNNSRRAMETMVYEIKKSKGLYTPTSTASTTSAGQISLEQVADATSGETTTYVDIFKCGNSLCLKREKQAPLALTNNQVKVTGLTFYQLYNSTTSPSIQMVLSVTGASTARPEYTTSLNLTTTANLRSY